MIQQLRNDAEKIISYSIEQVMPAKTVEKGLQGFVMPEGKTVLVSVGKAAWKMAERAVQLVNVDEGIVITKYGHVYGEIEKVKCYQAAHPVTDENGIAATRKAVEMVSGLTEKDTVLFLLSGGASALFEKPLISLEELQKINDQLLKCGADINEINAIRKRLSQVKGGRFAQICAPARVYSILLSDVIGNRADVIGSGPCYPDGSTVKEVKQIVEKYDLHFSSRVMRLLEEETPKRLDNAETFIGGSVDELCQAAGDICEKLGYETRILTTSLDCEAGDAGRELAEIIRKEIKGIKKPLAIIEGGETVVHVRGEGLGGRNQELALSACEGISGLNACVFSVGSDGTDGPTDAAGGYVDGDSMDAFINEETDVNEYLARNDSYNALKRVDGLIVTGPTGTNVNDLTVALIAVKE